jgi:hypothetical protein
MHVHLLVRAVLLLLLLIEPERESLVAKDEKYEAVSRRYCRFMKVSKHV